MQRRRRVPVMLQMDATECGAACLAMILGYYGREISVRECRVHCGIGRDGVTADILVKAARDYGLGVRALSVPQADLSAIGLPAMVHWNFSHFVVVERWTAAHVDVVDPASGYRRLTREQFDAGFTGVVLTFQPGPDFARRRQSANRAWRDYLTGLIATDGVRSVLVQILLASLLMQVFGLALPVLTKVAIDHIFPQRLVDAVNLLGIAMLLFIGAQIVMSYLRARLLIFLEARLDARMMLGFFGHLLLLPFEFFQRHHSGDLLMRLGNNAIIREAVTNHTLSAVLDGTLVMSYLAILLLADPMLGGIALAIAGAQLAVYRGSAASLRRLTEREINAVAESQSYATEALSAIAIVKASGAEGNVLASWSNLFHRHKNAVIERSRLAALLDSALTGLRLLAPFLLLWVGVVRVLDGSLSLGSMLAMNMLAASFLVPLASLITAAQRLQLVKVHLDRIVDVINTEVEEDATARKRSLRLSGNVELRHVSFRYDKHAPVTLRDISLSLRPGRKLALVGPSGCGKSTLAMLLLGLYRPGEGEILYDNIPLEELDRRALRGQFGVVLQDAAIFSGSIRQNISFHDPALALEDVKHAARLAAIHDDIMRMPMGYETRLAEGGSGLSGGQRQRLSLARALARKPVILLLDEATSHLDVATEAMVERNLDGLTCARIVIAHRLSTVRNADTIVVLEQGSIADSGPHEELLQRCGLYARMVRGQMPGAEDSRNAESTPACCSSRAPLR